MEQLILGIIQGVVEWLPISSEGLLVLTKINLFNSEQTISQILKEVLFLHLGTFFAALVYFRKDILRVVASVFSFQKADKETKNLLVFLFLSTAISGTIGFLVFKFLEKTTIDLETAGRTITFFIGLLLLVTGSLQLKSRSFGNRKIKDLKINDGLVLGLVQGLASFPGLSRSGTTVSALLLKKFDKKTALRLSFLMSLPVVFAGNIVLNLSEVTITSGNLLGLASSFVLGITTIHFLLKLAEKINFGLFVIGFGILTIISCLVA
jgi:undecaprenyl-diphosphatase